MKPFHSFLAQDEESDIQDVKVDFQAIMIILGS